MHVFLKFQMTIAYMLIFLFVQNAAPLISTVRSGRWLPQRNPSDSSAPAAEGGTKSNYVTAHHLLDKELPVSTENTLTSPGFEGDFHKESITSQMRTAGNESATALVESAVHHAANQSASGRGKSGKFLNLITWVRFTNEECAATTGDNGTCFTSAECTEFGGKASGTCASGFGVCCVLQVGIYFQKYVIRT
jgi:hypothetical protein